MHTQNIALECRIKVVYKILMFHITLISPENPDIAIKHRGWWFFANKNVFLRKNIMNFTSFAGGASGGASDSFAFLITPPPPPPEAETERRRLRASGGGGVTILILLRAERFKN